MTFTTLVCPKCGNKDPSMMEDSETQTRTADRDITMYEMVCNVCSYVWSKRTSSVPHTQVKHGK